MTYLEFEAIVSWDIDLCDPVDWWQVDDPIQLITAFRGRVTEISQEVWVEYKPVLGPLLQNIQQKIKDN